jgi:uncharacterized protein (TIGR03067 family)
MNRLCLAALAALACAAAPAPPSPEEAAKKDLEKMQGEWAVQSVRLGDKFMSSDKLAKAKVVIDGSKFVDTISGPENAMTIKLDPSKTPHAVDFAGKEGVGLVGIYDLDGDSLRLAFRGAAGKGPPEEKDRPAKFESAEDSGVVLFVLKRPGKAKYYGLPEEAQKALEAAKELDLYSLDPMPAKGEDSGDFHGWTVLGKATLKKDDAHAVAAAVVKGVADNDGSVAICFNPRHGVRVAADGKTFDFVICFECRQVEVYTGDKKVGETARTAAAPQKALDKLLKDAGVPLAPKSGAGK